VTKLEGLKQKIMNTFELGDKVCLITGGLSSYGLAITKLLLKRGSKVWIVDVKSPDQAMAKMGDEVGSCVRYHKADVSIESEYEGVFHKCLKETGKPPDVLIQAAAITGEKDWDRLYEVNLKGVHRGIELAFKHMSRDPKGGSSSSGIVLNVSDIFGVTCKLPPMKILPAYTASRYALTALTRSFGSDYWYKRTGVKVIAVTPHLMENDFLFNKEAPLDPSEETSKILDDHAASFKPLDLDEAALKLINVLNAAPGSVWYFTPNQLQPANLPDYVLPKVLPPKTTMQPFGVFGVNYGMGTGGTAKR